MNPSQPPEDLLRVMGCDGPEGLPLPLDPDIEARVRARLREQVKGLPAAVRSRRLRRFRVAVVGGLSLAAAACLVVLGARVLEEPSVVAPSWKLQPTPGGTLTWVDEGGAAHALREASAVAAPGRLETDAAASAHLITPQGIHLRMGPSTGLRPRKARSGGREPAIDLEHGQVDVQVPPLVAGESFAIRTHDTAVLVHGTRFKVALLERDGHRGTCVRVQEGRVEVRGPAGTHLLDAGDNSGCGEPGDAVPPSIVAPKAIGTVGGTGAARPNRRARSRGRARRVTRAEASEPAVAAASSGQLIEQNRLLSLALAAEREGQLSRAREAFKALIEKHPESPLAPEARRGLSRVAGKRRPRSP